MHHNWKTVTMILAALAGPLAADTITVRSCAEVQGDCVLLRDIAQLTGPQAIALADVTLARMPVAAVDLVAVRAALDSQNVNWGRLSLVGFNRCSIVRPPLRATGNDAESAALACDFEPCLPGTVGAEIMKLVAAQAPQAAPGDLRILLAPDDRPTARQPLAADRYELELGARGVPGRLPITIRRYRQERLVETRHLSAVIHQHLLGVVATRAIDRRQVLTADDIRITDLWLTDGKAKPLTTLEAAAGQATLRALREGEMVTAAVLAPPVLVERGEPVTVHCTTGAMLIKLAGTAMDDGAVGQVIRVRNEASRELFWAEVIGPRHAVATRVAPRQTSSQETLLSESRP